MSFSDSGYYTVAENTQNERERSRSKSETRHRQVKIVDRGTQSPEQYIQDNWRPVVGKQYMK